MAGMQFEYDEDGGTFYYFVLSFWSLVLIPATYYLWPRSKDKGEQQEQPACNCEPCQVKQILLKPKGPWVNAKEKSIKLGLIVGWLIFFLLAYKVSSIQMDFVEYDPFQELEVDRGANSAEVKKAYRRLSLIYHPDREKGDSKKFMRIAKAYAALTDEESRKNWEEHGNPDGPSATRFGIALPKWIVERENSMWVLAVYLLVFMIMLPVVVGMWWYRSIKFSGDQILLDTTHLYFYFISRTPNMILKRAVMILGASFEFDKLHNNEIENRPSDNDEIPVLLKLMPNIQKENKKPPLCYPYSVKARALMVAHFLREPLPPKSLELDKQYILKKATYLVNEMINICAQQVAMAMAGRLQQSPRLETVENLMKLNQLLIQAVEEKSSPLLQLPHITADMLRHFIGKKRNIRGIHSLVAMKEEDRRSMLRGLSDEEYQDVMAVCSSMPHVTMEITSEVLDDEDKSITAGSIVTVTVVMTREALGVKFEKELCENTEDNLQNLQENEGDEEVADEVEGKPVVKNKPKVWEKQKKKGRHNAAAKQKKKPKPNTQWKAAAPKPDAKSDKPQANGKPVEVVKTEDEEEEADEDREHSSDMSEDEKTNNSEEEQVVIKEKEKEKEKDKEKDKKEDEDEDEEEEDWSKFQEESRKENSLETKVKESHIVHCPYFPAEKQEWWWLYVADRKHHQLITAPVQICSLKTEEEMLLKFSAPRKPGVYQYSVILRSDSYLSEFDNIVNFKMDVKEAKVVTDHPQWDISDDEGEKEEEDEEDSDDSDYSSEDDDDE